MTSMQVLTMQTCEDLRSLAETTKDGAVTLEVRADILTQLCTLAGGCFLIAEFIKQAEQLAETGKAAL